MSLRLSCVLIALSFLPQIRATDLQPSVHWIPASANEHAAVEVRGLTAATLSRLARSNHNAAQWQRVFAIHAIPAGLTEHQGLPPMLGAYRIHEGALRFEPQFPLVPGVTYRAVYTDMLSTAGKRRPPITADFRLPDRETLPTTVVSRIFPSADVLPENLL
jgi:hypothetical protein